MMEFLKKFFSTEEKATDKIDNSDLDVAIIAILLRASSIDGNKDELELDMIKDIAIKDLNIEEDEFDNLYSRAIEEEDFSADIYKWTKIVNDNCDENLKLNIFRL
ncbi:MAG: TerB family tellurite resistance protein, partial [Alphaproteobacteria bacterium]